MLFATCSYSLFGQSSFYHRMETAIDIGTYESEFFYEGTFDTRKFSNDYVLPSYKEPDYSFGNDIFLKLTLTRSMDIWVMPIYIYPCFLEHIISLRNQLNMVQAK